MDNKDKKCETTSVLKCAKYKLVASDIQCAKTSVLECAKYKLVAWELRHTTCQNNVTFAYQYMSSSCKIYSLTREKGSNVPSM